MTQLHLSKSRSHRSQVYFPGYLQFFLEISFRLADIAWIWNLNLFHLHIINLISSLSLKSLIVCIRVSPNPTCRLKNTPLPLKSTNYPSATFLGNPTYILFFLWTPLKNHIFMWTPIILIVFILNRHLIV